MRSGLFILPALVDSKTGASVISIYLQASFMNIPALFAGFAGWFSIALNGVRIGGYLTERNFHLLCLMAITRITRTTDFIRRWNEAFDEKELRLLCSGGPGFWPNTSFWEWL